MDPSPRARASRLPSPAAPGPVGAVTADDVALAVRLAVRALDEVPADGWERPAGDLTWSCWETVEHLADDLFAYALQLGPGTPPLTTHVPVSWRKERPDGPTGMVFVARAEGPAGLLQALEACGALLVAMVRTTAPEVRAHHVFGASDPEGFGAMGVVETLVHTHDVAAAFGLPWRPPAGLCARTLHRLFPDAPADAEPWPALLWSTGRAALPGRDRLEKWRWQGAPRP
ncbi:DinB family protein [Actinacidiphila reveromycinica]|uniref:DinB family protein n=1 Tax=Actinacidiphila reveromycinica TaxID=659352 RepID=UPI001F3116D9|nr:DinB family protein [Streptomyces sp. SN-593]